MIAPRAVVIDDQHLQATYTLTCSNDNCRRTVSVPTGFDRLIIDRISCDIRGATNAQFLNSTYAVISPTDVPLVTIFMGPNIEAAERGIFILNSWPSGGLYVTRPNRAHFLIQLTQPVNNGACTVIGRLRVLATASTKSSVRETEGLTVPSDVGIASE
jgi:hypothetical protein